jgi:hypothetical protein
LDLKRRLERRHYFFLFLLSVASLCNLDELLPLGVLPPLDVEEVEGAFDLTIDDGLPPYFLGNI